ncbi:MAG: hypothetical protein JXQ82_07610 [Methanomicrobiaceae archaeon]|nr:hypothetical protein [Methanomicrobiaceae archaeon]
MTSLTEHYELTLIDPVKNWRALMNANLSKIDSAIKGAELKDPLVEKVVSITQDTERKMYYDDFSNNTSENFTGDVSSFVWDTANKKITTKTATLSTIAHNPKYLALNVNIENPQVAATTSGGIYFVTSGGDIYKVFIYAYVISAGSEAYRIIIYKNGSQIAFTANESTSSDFDYLLELIFDSDGFEIYRNGVLQTLFSGDSDIGDVNITSIGISTTSSGDIASIELKNLVGLPSISYADDYSADTSARHQLIAGAGLSYSTDKMLLQSATDVLAVERLKHYKYTEGYFKKRLVTSSAYLINDVHGVMFATIADGTSNIVVGIKQTGSGAVTPYIWKDYGQSGQVVLTNGTSQSGYGSAASFIVETIVDPDHGVIYAWVYLESGTKPTAPTMIAYTNALSSPFHYGTVFLNKNTGTRDSFFDDLVTRANLIAGTTNCESNEAYYFREDFGSNSIGRFNYTGTWTVTAGYLRIMDYAGDRNFVAPFAKVKDENHKISVTGIAECAAGSCRFMYGFGLQQKSGSGNFLDTPWDGYVIRAYLNSTTVQLYRNNIGGGSTSIGSATYDFGSLGTTHDFEIDRATDGTITVLINGSEVISVVDDTIGEGFFGIATSLNSFASSSFEIRYDDWQVDGTRVYPTPINRGTQVGLIEIDGENVVCTALSIDFETSIANECSHLAWTQNLLEAYIYSPAPSQYWVLNSVMFDNAEAHYIRFKISSDNVAAGRDSVYFGFASCASEAQCGKYYIQSSGILKMYIEGGSAIVVGTLIPSRTANTYYDIAILFTGAHLYGWCDGVLTIDTAAYAPEPISGYFGFSEYGMNLSCHPKIKDLVIIGHEANSPNGISLGIPSLSHGGRYGVTEKISWSATLEDIVSGDWMSFVSAKSTSATESESLRITAKNVTDDTHIDSDGGTDTSKDVAMDGTVKNNRWKLQTNDNDRNKVIEVSLQTASGDPPASTIQVSQNIFKPIVYVTEEELA